MMYARLTFSMRSSISAALLSFQERNLSTSSFSVALAVASFWSDRIAFVSYELRGVAVGRGIG